MARLLILIAILFGVGYALLRLITGGGGDEEVETVVAALTGSGYTLTIGETEVDDGRTRLTDVQLAGPAGPLAWQISAPTVLVERGEGGRVALDFASPVAFRYTVGSEARTATLTAPRLRVDLMTEETGAIRQATFSATDLAVTRHGGGDPLLAKSARLHLVRPAGVAVVPAGATVQVDLDDVTVPEQRDGPFGPLIDRIALTLTVDRALATLALGTELPAWQAAADGTLTVSSAEVDWGTLALKADGKLDIDPQYRPAGEFNIAITGVMAMLDAVHAVRRFDSGIRANAYATLLQEAATPPATPPHYVIRIADGNVTLVRPVGGLPAFRLGGVSPIATLP